MISAEQRRELDELMRQSVLNPRSRYCLVSLPDSLVYKSAMVSNHARVDGQILVREHTSS